MDRWLYYTLLEEPRLYYIPTLKAGLARPVPEYQAAMKMRTTGHRHRPCVSSIYCLLLCLHHCSFTGRLQPGRWNLKFTRTSSRSEGIPLEARMVLPPPVRLDVIVVAQPSNICKCTESHHPLPRSMELFTSRAWSQIQFRIQIVEFSVAGK
jgi:hypothetical protein